MVPERCPDGPRPASRASLVWGREWLCMGAHMVGLMVPVCAFLRKQIDREVYVHEHTDSPLRPPLCAFMRNLNGNGMATGCFIRGKPLNSLGCWPDCARMCARGVTRGTGRPLICANLRPQRGVARFIDSRVWGFGFFRQIWRTPLDPTCRGRKPEVGGEEALEGMWEEGGSPGSPLPDHFDHPVGDHFDHPVYVTFGALSEGVG